MRDRLHQAMVVVATLSFGGWRYRGKLLATIIAGVAVALLVAAHTTYTYGGTAQLQIGPPPGSTTSSGASLGVSPAQLEDAVAIVESPQLHRDTATLLGRTVAATPVASATILPDTDQVQIRVVDRTSRSAASEAVSYADAYIAAEQLAGVTNLEMAASAVAAHVATLGAKVDALDARIVAAGGPAPPAATSATGLAPAADPGISGDEILSPIPAVAALQAQRGELIDEEAVMAQQAASLQADASAFTGGGTIVSGGVPDTHPVSPDRVRDGVLGGLVAGALGLGAAGAFEWRRHGAVTPRVARGQGHTGADVATAPGVTPAGVGDAANPGAPARANGAAGGGASGARDGGANGAGTPTRAGAGPAPARTVVLRPRVPGVGEVAAGTGSLRFVARDGAAHGPRAGDQPDGEAPAPSGGAAPG